MRAGGVGIAPDALDRLVEMDALAPGRCKQCVDCLQQQPRGEGVIEAIAQPHIERRRLAPHGGRMCFAQIAMQHQAGGIDAARGLRNARLDGGEIGHFAVGPRDRAAGFPAAHHAHEIGECALSHAQDRRDQCARQYREERLAIERIGVDLRSGPGARDQIGHRQGAVHRHEHALGDDGLAASAGEPHRVPGVLDLDLFARHEKKHRLGRTGTV